MANAIRFLSMDGCCRKGEFEPPGPADGRCRRGEGAILLLPEFNPKAPLWADRNLFVQSAGRGSMLIYSLLYLTGYEDMTIEALKQFRELGSKTAGHPEYGHASGIATTTGPLG